MKKNLLFLLFALLPMVASADPVLIDGIYYYLYAENKVAEVTSEGKYSGEVVIPSSVTYNDVEYSVTSIGERAFYECSSLTSITIPNSVTSIGMYAFKGTAWYNNQPDGLVYAGKVAYKYKGDMPENTKIILNDGTLGIGERAFDGCSGLTSITIPNSVTSISDYAFSGCSGLTSITIGNSVTSIGEHAFYLCRSLTSITIPNSVTSIGGSAFGGCTSLTSITIPNSVTTIGGAAFSSCSSLTSITIPNSVTSIGSSAFSGCSGLTSITIGNSVTSIGEYTFKGCSNLSSITIPNSVTSIGNYAFRNCSSLTSITIPNSVTTIGEHAFDGCSGLTSITIPNSVTSIGRYAFYGCSLNTVIIGSGIKYINYNAFGYCQNIENVYCYAVRHPSTDKTAFENSYPDYITLHVPSEGVEQYAAIEPWSNFHAVVAIKSGDPSVDGGGGEGSNSDKCATPTISYGGKKLTFGCETEGVEYVYSIKDTDIKQGYDAEVTLTATYEISVYATKAGYDNSNVATATLVWGSATFTDTTPATAIEMVPAMEAAMPVLIQNNGGMLTVQGAQDGTPVSVYTTAGTEAGSAVSQNSRATISTSMQQGDIAIVRIGNRSVKVVLK